MTSKKRITGQAIPLKGRRSTSGKPPRAVVSAAGKQVSGIRRDLLRYVDFHPALITLTAFAIVALVCVIYLGQVTAVTNANYTLQALQTEHTNLMREKENLQLQIARAQSLSNIEGVAKGRLQMVPIGDHYRYLMIAPGPLQGLNPDQPDQSSINAGTSTTNP